VASGTTITIPIGTTTLKVGLLISGQVSGVTTRTYEVKEKKTTEVVIPSFCTMNANETCAFFESPETWTNNVKCYAWTNGGPLYAGSWPGEDCTYLGEAPNGNRVWKWSYKGALTTQPGMIIFNNSDRPQTSDMKFENGGYYTRDGIFGNVAQGIDSPVFDSQSISIVYDLSGRRVDSQTLKPGLYIINHKKMLIK
jgi:hypothetical protein